MIRVLSTTDWYSGNVKPVRKGWYEVRNNVRLHWNSRWLLAGRKSRYWDGKQWLIAVPCPNKEPIVSIFGGHESHEWRGITIESHLREKRIRRKYERRVKAAIAAGKFLKDKNHDV